MKLVATRKAQRGVTLFVGLIMLVLITLMVTSAFMLSNTNLRSVANMQSRDEAIAAANSAVSQVLSSPFTDHPAAEEINVDINNDNQAEYVVSVAVPVCVRASVDTTATVSSETLPGMSTVNTWNTTWDIVATAQDVKTGTKTIVNVGVRVLLEQAEKDAVCT